MREHWDAMSRVERSVCRLLTGRGVEWLLYATAAELGSESGTSNATVVRTLQRLGYQGLSDFKHGVATSFSSTVAPPIRLRQRMEHLGASVDKISESTFDEAAEQLALLRSLDQSADLAGAAALLAGAAGTIHTYGIGLSSIVAEFLAISLTRGGRPARHLRVGGFRFADEMLGVRHGDVVVVIVPGRMIDEISVLLDRARAVGAEVVLVSDELRDSLGVRASVTLHAPDSPTGTTTELYTATLVCTVLAQAVSAVDQALAVESSHTLTSLRQELGY